MAKRRILQLDIADISRTGQGVAKWERPDGAACEVEVPFSMPGDRVEVELGRKKRGRYTSFVQEFMHLSPKRAEPKCLHFAQCGGCSWQHIPYEQQLKIKEGWIRQCLASTASADAQWHPIIPCTPPWSYRNKMEFSFSQNLKGERFLGLMRHAGKGRVEQLSECHLCDEWMMEGLEVVRKWWEESGLNAYHPPKNIGSLRSVTFRQGKRTGDRMVVLLVSGNPDYALSKGQINAFKEQMASLKGSGELSVFLRIQQIQKGQPTQFYEMLLAGPDHIKERLEVGSSSLEFTISPSAFFQPNTEQAEKLYAKALELSGLRGGVVYDLYCGTGTLGILAAPFAKHVVGIELSPESALDARTNAKRNDVENFEVITGDVGKVLSTRSERADVVMVDPPRVGLDDTAINHLLKLKAHTIVYISCNPKSQGENLEPLVQQGYDVVQVQPVDQFPHTTHVENIVVLARG